MDFGGFTHSFVTPSHTFPAVSHPRTTSNSWVHLLKCQLAKVSRTVICLFWQVVQYHTCFFQKNLLSVFVGVSQHEQFERLIWSLKCESFGNTMKYFSCIFCNYLVHSPVIFNCSLIIMYFVLWPAIGLEWDNGTSLKMYVILCLELADSYNEATLSTS